MLKTQKGITLVALVVTIIVLIILAGISINLLMGNNGILTRAKESKVLHEKADLKEQMQLAITAKQVDGKGVVTQSDVEAVLGTYGTVNKNTDGTIKSVTTTEKGYEIALSEIYTGEIKTIAISYNKNDAGTTGTMENSGATVVASTFTAPSGKQFKEWNSKADGTGTKYEVGDIVTEDITLYAIWEDRVVSKNTGALGTALNATDYGKQVTNYVVTGKENLVWRLFYEDINNVYLISETSTGNYPVNSVSLVNYSNSTYSPKNSKYVSGASVSTQGQALMPLASSLFTSSNTNPNIWGTAYLCDTDDDGPWAGYKTQDASWAMGSPTIELFAASYNATHIGGNQISLTVNGMGYTHNTSSGWFQTSENGKIYRLKSSSSYWWLASPGSSDANDVRLVREGYGALGSNYASYSRSARPVVCLQKSNFTYTLAN